MQGQKICVCALAGALLFGAGDWLLGFVSPEPVAGAFYFISEGHGADFAPWRITATLLCSVVAAPLFCYALSHTGTALCGSAACGRALDAASGLCAFGWLFLHLIVTFHVAAYGIAARMSGAMQAASFNIYINTNMMKDKDLAKKINGECTARIVYYGALADAVFGYTTNTLINTVIETGNNI